MRGHRDRCGPGIRERVGGAHLTIGGWECNSSSSQEPGRASTCRAAGDGVIIAIAGASPEGRWCELVDDLTLDQMLADGEPAEAVCATYIDGETSIDQQETPRDLDRDACSCAPGSPLSG